jgi:ABC-2 type transport system ATP-binding protein
MIRARGLTRSFPTRTGPVEAVRGVDLDVEPGEIVGFLGPNGAGKTTTLRILTTLLTPTSGQATVAGRDLLRDPVGVRRRIGYVAQGGVTYAEARTGEEVVDQARLYGIPAAEATRRGHELFAQLDLEGLWGRPCKSLSGGQRRRLDIVIGLVHTPQLVFLDEPTTGLDPQSRANLWGHVRRLRGELGTTVFLTTHYLDEADALCDRVLVIDHGTIVASGTPEQLKQQVSGDAITLTLTDSADAGAALAVVAALDGAAGADLVGRSPEGSGDGSGVPDAGAGPAGSPVQVVVRVPHGGAVLPGLLRELDAKGIALDAVEVRRPTLDDVFLSLTGRSLRDEPAA